jgi:hypothetical protein
MSLNSITDFLEPVNKFHVSDDYGYTDTQIGARIAKFEEEGAINDLNEFDCVLVGCRDMRGSGLTDVQRHPTPAL